MAIHWAATEWFSIARYPVREVIYSRLNPIEDILIQIESLKAAEYTSDILRSTHHLPAAGLKRRASEVVAHARAAIDFANAGLSTTGRTSYLLLYYSILNFLKIYILIGPHYDLLPEQRWHGAQYLGQKKESHTLLTDEIRLQRKGALSLFYRTVTGSQLSRPFKLQMRDIYPFIKGIGAEYHLATGKHLKLWPVSFRREQYSSTDTHVTVSAKIVPTSGSQACSFQELKLLSGFKAVSGQPGIFARGIPGNFQNEEAILPFIRPFLLYQNLNQSILTPITSKRLLLPEELPIALLFFHMSNVVRYNPGFLSRLEDSRFWPLLLAARRHALLDFLLLFWSNMKQKEIELTHP
jgi:hypothetical protein